MKKGKFTLIVSLMLAVCLIGCTTNNRKVKKIEIEGILLNEYEEIETAEGSFLKDGYFKEWHLNGQISLIGECCMNKRCGYWKSYRDDGTMYEEGNYVNDKKDGLWKEYQKDGQVIEMMYKNGNYAKILGTWIDDDKVTWVFNEDGRYRKTDANGNVTEGDFKYNRETSVKKLKTGGWTWNIEFENDSLFSAHFTTRIIIDYYTYKIKNARKQP